MKNESGSSVVEKLRSLGSYRPEDWGRGAYSTDQIDDVEKRLGRAFDSDHRAVLERMGGNFLFETGAARFLGGEYDVVAFFGSGEPNDIIEWWEGSRGQIPQGWYPFAKDAMGDIYCVTSDGAVHHVRLQEELWTRDERPETSGVRVAASFSEFVMSLQLPDWAMNYLAAKEP